MRGACKRTQGGEVASVRSLGPAQARTLMRVFSISIAGLHCAGSTP